MIEFDARTENLENAENRAEYVGQSKISRLDFDFVSRERYRESEYEQKLISRFPSLSILLTMGKRRSEFDGIGMGVD
jgi:hypothetical protein